MADDMDIEEHDILENPIIKSIFPDLTIIKKEIYEYSNYEHEESSQNSNADESSSTTQAVVGAIDQKQNTCSSGLNNNTFKNKIIVGSKHSSGKHKKQNLDVSIRKAKVCLPNITQILNNKNTFCKICLILFPTQESLNRHALLAHKNTQKNCMANENLESNKVKRTSYECQKCNKNFANLGNLNRHERNIHSHSNKLKNKDDDKHMTEVNFMVKINDFNHYKIDKTNEQTGKVENKNVPEDKNIEQEHQSIENDGMKGINTDKIYACPICSYCFNVWDFYEAHMKKKHSLNKVKRTSKVVYEPKCKFCDLQYSTFKSYNVHLHKRHKSKILQKVKMQSCNNEKMTTTKETIKLMVQKKQTHK